jgi:hypothetical protein
MSIWNKHNSVYVAEMSTLDANGYASGPYVVLPDKETTKLLTPEMREMDSTGEDIMGWRFKIDGQEYLVIND